MSEGVRNVLFLCTGKSARSIFGEALLNHMGTGHMGTGHMGTGHMGAGRFRGYSAGSRPRGSVHPLTLKLLSSLGIPTAALRSKNWDEFAVPGAPEMDFIITVCDDAAGEECPVWPGQPVTAHWGLPDPAAAIGNDMQREHAFRNAFLTMERRINLLLSLKPAALDAASLRHHLSEIPRQDTQDQT